MLSMKETKNGGIVIVFGKEYAELAKSVFPMISAKMFGGVDVLPFKIDETKKEESLSDVVSRVEGNTQKLRLNAPSTRALTKQEIHDKIYKMSKSIESNLRVHRKTLWTEVYNRLIEITDLTKQDIDSTKKSAIFTNGNSANKYNTLVDKGYGYEILTIINKLFKEYANR